MVLHHDSYTLNDLGEGPGQENRPFGLKMPQYGGGTVHPFVGIPGVYLPRDVLEYLTNKWIGGIH